LNDGFAFVLPDLLSVVEFAQPLVTNAISAVAARRRVVRHPFTGVIALHLATIKASVFLPVAP